MRILHTALVTMVTQPRNNGYTTLVSFRGYTDSSWSVWLVRKNASNARQVNICRVYLPKYAHHYARDVGSAATLWLLVGDI